MADGQAAPLRGVAAHPLAKLRLGWRRRVPVVLQTEAAECALACLAMIARYHGHEVDLTALRRRFSTSLRGANLARLMRDAHALGFVTRPLRLELEELGQLKTPCIVHWDLNHFVVLERVGTRQVIVHDPARGTRRMPLSDVSRHFTGVALELEPGVDFRPVKEKQRISLRALTGSLRGWMPALAQILGLAVALEVFALSGPFYLQWVLDHVLVSADRNLLMLLAIGFAAITFLQVIVSAARSWAVVAFGTRVGVQWSAQLVHHLLKLPLDWFDKRHIGDITSRLQSSSAIQHALSMQIIGSLLDGIMAVASLFVMVLYSVRLTLFVVVIFGLYGLVRWVFYLPLRRATEDSIVFAARQQSDLLQLLRGVMPIKLACQEVLRGSMYTQKMVETANRNIVVQRLGIAFSSINQLLFGMAQIALIWMAATLVLGGRFTAGMLMAFIAYSGQFTSRAGALIDTWVDFRMLGLHAERLADIVLNETEPDLDGGHTGTLPNTELEVKNLGFRYAQGESWVLHKCSFRITPGECVAIVGPSDCGKTTLAKLVLGLLEPEEGEVLFGGVDIRKLGLSVYRNQVAAVMQENQLFSGTLAENIAFSEPRIRQSRIEAAARMAAVHEDIMAMPMGYQTLVGDMGSSLSSGQKQRVMLARALYRRPKVLVLDEATSHLDGETERAVNKAVSRLRLTRILIAHREQTIAMADRVIRLERGAV